MNYCYLDDNPKNFEYFKEYLIFLEESNHRCLDIDNKIQYNEIMEHLNLNGFFNSSDEIKRQEMLNWINNNAKKFRTYLNTLKLIYIIWKGIGLKIEDLNYEIYLKIKNNLNNINNDCLISIF